MAHSIQHAAKFDYTAQVLQKPFASKFISWCANEESEHHFMWTGIALVTQGAVLFPFTMLSMFIAGAPFWLLLLPIISLGIVVVPNLAALNTKYTIPIYLLSIVLNILALIIAFL